MIFHRYYVTNIYVDYYLVHMNCVDATQRRRRREGCTTLSEGDTCHFVLRSYVLGTITLARRNILIPTHISTKGSSVLHYSKNIRSSSAARSVKPARRGEKRNRREKGEKRERKRTDGVSCLQYSFPPLDESPTRLVNF